MIDKHKDQLQQSQHPIVLQEAEEKRLNKIVDVGYSKVKADEYIKWRMMWNY
jgi:hypothetical protein